MGAVRDFKNIFLRNFSATPYWKPLPHYIVEALVRATKTEVKPMPKRPNTPCRHPGCAELVPYGTKYCDKHRSLHPEDTRSAGSRGYGTAWNKARKRYLETHPLCAECLKEGRYVKATDVDHIKPHRGDNVLFWDQGNWQSLCHRHHSIKTRNEDHTPEYKY